MIRRMINRRKNKKKKVTGHVSSNVPSQGEKELHSYIVEDSAQLTVPIDARKASNQTSLDYSSFVMDEVVDCANTQSLKLSQTLNDVEKPGFKGEDLTAEILKEKDPAWQPLIEWCTDFANADMSFFVQVYLGALRGEGSLKASAMRFHRDLPKVNVCGREPDLRVCMCRIQPLIQQSQSDENEEVVEKVFSFRQLIDGTSDQYHIVRFAQEDFDVFLLGPLASGKFSNVQHQPSIYGRNSVSTMCDIFFPDDSPFKQFTIPQIAQYWVNEGIFAHKTHVNVRYGK